MSLREFEFQHWTPATPATPATKDPESVEKSQLSQLSQGVTSENEKLDIDQPSQVFGPQAAVDAQALAHLIDAATGADLDVIRARAASAGVAGLRWAFGLAALPERLNRAN